MRMKVPTIFSYYILKKNIIYFFVNCSSKMGPAFWKIIY